jgi:hypothetical protein
MRGRRLVVPGWANGLIAGLVPRMVPRGLLLKKIAERQVRRRA